MNPRTTAILFLVAATLGAFVYFYEVRGGEQRKDAEALAKRLFPGIEAEAITELVLTTGDGGRARLERRDEGWQLVEPVRFPADEFEVDAMASALAQISSEAVYEDPQPPEVYGLGEGAQQIEFAAGEARHRLRIGDKTPMGGNSYASREGSDDVYAVRTYRVSALSKSLDDLRDKRVLRFDTDSVRRLVARWRDGGVVLERDGDAWRIVEPVEGRADQGTVRRVLSSLSFLRATGFVDEERPDAETGLDEPELRVELSLAPGEEGGEPERIGLAMAREQDGERLVRGQRDTIYRVPAARIEDVPREVAAWRFKELARFPVTDAERVELLFQPEGAEPVTVTLSRGEAGWSSAPEEMAPDRIENLVDELSELEAEDILADAMGAEERRGLGLDPPRVTIRVYAGQGDEEKRVAEVQLGSYRGSKGVVAQTPGDPTVYQLARSVAEFVPVSLDAFRNRFLAGDDMDADDDEAGLSDFGELPDPLALPDESP